MADQWKELRERAADLTVEADDLETVRAAKTFKEYWDSLDIESLDIDGVVKLGDQMVAVIEGMFGEGTVDELFCGDRVKFSGLMAAFDEIGKKVSASVDAQVEATKEFTETVAE